MAHLKRWLMLSAAVVLFLLGLASVWTPFPIGAIMMMAATVMLITHSRTGRSFVRRVRRRFAFIDNLMIWFEDRSQASMVRILKTTRPLESRLKVR
ncbi:hypothetical protein SAMN04515647_2779 [Cohaesibacter sp. ES.047]|uniref:hypothetical protein n=1 Tax=Cohaesibacter sp. ES.047 TaxID=1798205 RepID=UPI000BB6C161|nr:hypothetical protein [Cohaesibacter sp. ES.047]SNY92506.1 hypothetical protein SAMN04515647_2779 [Cohaesibacter sp. ES.047]